MLKETKQNMKGRFGKDIQIWWSLGKKCPRFQGLNAVQG